MCVCALQVLDMINLEGTAKLKGTATIVFFTGFSLDSCCVIHHRQNYQTKIPEQY